MVPWPMGLGLHNQSLSLHQYLRNKVRRSLMMLTDEARHMLGKIVGDVEKSTTTVDDTQGGSVKI